MSVSVSVLPSRTFRKPGKLPIVCGPWRPMFPHEDITRPCKEWVVKWETIERKHPTNHGPDKISYDPKHLAYWQMPDSISKNLPTTLSSAVKDWSEAGAAILTAFDRIDALWPTASERAYPAPSKDAYFKEQEQNQENSRRDSVLPSRINPGSATNAPSPPSAISPAIKGNYSDDKAAGLSLDKLKLGGSPPRALRAQIGLESPPATPIDSKGYPSPSTALQDIKGNYCSNCGFNLDNPTTAATAAAATAPSPPSSGRSSVAFLLPEEEVDDEGDEDPDAVKPPNQASFSESAWQVYERACVEEHFAILHVALPRLKGLAKIIQRTVVELAMDENSPHCGIYPKEGGAGAEVERFLVWWNDVAKNSMAEIEVRVKEVKVPAVGDLSPPERD